MLTSQDLRRRIVSTFETNGGVARPVAKQFLVATITVRRIVKLKKETGDIKPRPHGGGRERLIQDSELPKLKSLVAEKSDRTTKELIEQWFILTGKKVSHATMIRALQRAKLTVKKRLSGLLNAIPKKIRKSVKITKMR